MGGSNIVELCILLGIRTATPDLSENLIYLTLYCTWITFTTLCTICPDLSRLLLGIYKEEYFSSALRIMRVVLISECPLLEFPLY